MKKVLLGLASTAIFACSGVFAEQAEISGGIKSTSQIIQNTPLNTPSEQVGSAIPTYSELKQEYEEKDILKEKTKKLLIRMNERIKELKLKIAELSEKNGILEKENSTLQDQLQKLQNDYLDNNEKTNLLNIKLLSLEQEKEDLLQKLFDNQLDVQEIKSVSFELNSLLNQIHTEDDITRDCVKFLESVTDLNNRIDTLIKEAEHSELTFIKEQAISSLLKELQSTQTLIDKKLKFFQNHEQKLLDIHKEEISSVPSRLEQLKTLLNTEQKKYPELAKLKLEENLMNSVNTIKALRLSKSKEEAKSVKVMEKALYDYVGLKIKESDLNRLETKTKDFSSNINKLELMSADFVKKYSKLEEIRNSALLKVSEAKAVNDNSSKKPQAPKTELKKETKENS